VRRGPTLILISPRGGLERLGYRLVDLPKTDVAARSDFVLERLG